MQASEGFPFKITSYQIILVETKVDGNYFRLISKFLSLNRQCRGIYVSSNRSTKDLSEKLRACNFDLDAELRAGQISIIDLVSRSVGDHEIDGTVNVPSPSELSATQMAIEKVISRFNPEPNNTWLIIDSLPTLLIFNGAGALLHFLHFLIGRLRVLGCTGIIFTSEGALNSRVFSTVAQLCDTVIKSIGEINERK